MLPPDPTALPPIPVHEISLTPGGATFTPLEPVYVQLIGRTASVMIDNMDEFRRGGRIAWQRTCPAAPCRNAPAYLVLPGETLIVSGYSWSDFNGDGDSATDADTEAMYACLGGNCCATCDSADVNGDGDVGTDLDIEVWFRLLGGTEPIIP